MRTVLFAMGLMWASLTYADITVSDVTVFSGYPWREVVIGYTITGTDAGADFVRLTATDKSANKTYTARSLTGAETTEGQHALRWNAAGEGIKFSSSQVVFSVSIVSMGVQLWANGPYWAECNVGATKPEEYGYYFWWGDTVGYKRNASNNGWVSVADGRAFSFESGNCPTEGKDGKSNSQLKTAGYIDSTGNLVAKYDAATKYFGSRWRMPTDAEISALISNCTTTWGARNGVKGMLVTGKGAYASKSIFLPAAGHGHESVIFDLDSFGFYWSSTPYSDDSRCARSLRLKSSDSYRSYDGRYCGQSVRPVRGFAK